MTAEIGHRVRWFLVWILVAVWFAGLAFRWLGDWLNLTIVGALLMCVYELLADDRFGAERERPGAAVQALTVHPTSAPDKR